MLSENISSSQLLDLDSILEKDSVVLKVKCFENFGLAFHEEVNFVEELTLLDDNVRLSKFYKFGQRREDPDREVGLFLN